MTNSENINAKRAKAAAALARIKAARRRDMHRIFACAAVLFVAAFSLIAYRLSAGEDPSLAQSTAATSQQESSNSGTQSQSSGESSSSGSGSGDESSEDDWDEDDSWDDDDDDDWDDDDWDDSSQPVQSIQPSQSDQTTQNQSAAPTTRAS